MTRRVQVALDVLLPDDADMDRLLVRFAAVVDAFGGGIVSAEAGTIDVPRDAA